MISETFGLGQTNWADKFCGIWGIFGRTISTHLGTVSSLSMFSNHQLLSLQKTKLLYSYPKCLFVIGIWIWEVMNYGFSHRVSVVRGLGCILHFHKTRTSFKREFLTIFGALNGYDARAWNEKKICNKKMTTSSLRPIDLKIVNMFYVCASVQWKSIVQESPIRTLPMQ